jgi:protein-S-isoprenylcysteine O-methyltransferase Ste14
MLMLIRQLVSLIALPITVTIAIPIWIARRNHVTFAWPANAPSLALVLVGVVVGAVGLVLFAACVFYFWIRGRGTLAPWDPPRHFVADGPYRFVRNPMISGVTFILAGEACIVRSMPLAEWAGLFIVINAIYIPLLEEPMLVTRFGETYRRYRHAVPRFLPRLRPWSPDRPQ